MKPSSKAREEKEEKKEEKIFFKNSRNQKLAGVLHRPRKKTFSAIIILHGYASSKDGKAKKLAAFFAKNGGYAALRFDFTGCGESEGALRGDVARQESSDAVKAINFLGKLGFTRFGVIGSSLGGLVATAATAADDRVKATVALCPPTRFDDFNGLTKARRARAILFIHGSSDEIVHYEESQALYAAARQPKKLVLVRGADHRFSSAKHLKRVEREALAWFNEFLNDDYEGELTEETLKEIKQGEADYRTGRVYSTKHVLRKLGVK